MLITFDAWLIARTKSLLDFIFEWFGITQKLVERALIVAFGLANFIEITSRLLNIPEVRNLHTHYSWQLEGFLGGFFLLALWRNHKMPAAQRTEHEHTALSLVFRYMFSFTAVLSLVSFALELFQITLFSFALDIQSWSVTLFFYVVAVNNIDGERKSAKLAWSKIKELFGTAWIPQPTKGTS